MKGYQTIKQFVEDYKLYLVAKRIDPGRESGDTITRIMKKKIDEKLNKASKRFRIMMETNNYSVEDLRLIAVHDCFARIHDVGELIKEAYNLNRVNNKMMRRFLLSNAFKKGRLEKISVILPIKIRSKLELRKFVKRRRNMSHSEFKTIIQVIAPKEWKVWFDELVEEGLIELDGGMIWA